MSAMDRAFIRAYETDEETTTMPARRPPPRSHNHDSKPAPHTRAFADPAPVVGSAPSESQRRPLSTFTAPVSTVEASFQPALEVDAFLWSAVSNELVGKHHSYWGAVVQQLLTADDAGCSLIGVGSTSRRTGNTTVLGCLARLLAELGKSVAIVDGDFATAGLGRSLGLVAEIGWEDVLAGRVPLTEAVITSLHDRIALLPLVQGGVPAAEKLDAIHASITAGVLRYHYDIVLYDLGVVADSVQGPIARRIARRCRLDGTLLIASGATSAIHPEQLSQIAPELADICLGVIANQSVTT